MSKQVVMASSRAIALLVWLALPAAALQSQVASDLEAGSKADLELDAGSASGRRADLGRRATKLGRKAALGRKAHLDKSVLARRRLEQRAASDLERKADLEADLERKAVLEMYRQGNSEGVVSGLQAASEFQATSEVTYSPEERLQLHSAKFEKEFTVDLDVASPENKDLPVGVVLDIDTDFTPVSVYKVRKTGLLEAWNKANPDRAVMVGDQIIKVNEIIWHHNSQTFGDRIKGQFLASRELKEGAKSSLTLSIQRPRKDRRARFASQREDMHQSLYSAEFFVQIPFTGVQKQQPLHSAMGWKLNRTVDWKPISIEKLGTTGLVAKFNEENPEHRIYAGDEILQVNNIKWHHSSKVFEERLQAQFMTGQSAEFTKPEGAKNVLQLYIRRPRAVNDVPDDQVYTKEFLVMLNLKNALPLGWLLNASSEADPIRVEKIHKSSALHEFNEANPTKRVQPGDAIVRVNDVLWRGNSKKFAERIGKELESVRPRKAMTNSTRALSLLVQRRVVQPIIKEWSVTLPVAKGKILGWHLNFTDDALPLTVDKVRSKGVVFEHNQMQPEMKISSGDIIVKVNDVLWRKDSSVFENRINEEYSKSKKTGNITFFLRRPSKTTEDDASEAERLFMKEFLVELPITGKNLGWQLKSDNETAPISVAKVHGMGTVPEWNGNNPLDGIEVGDEITKVNNILWHGNTQQFMARLNTQIEAARKGHGKPNVTLLLRRPWHSAKENDPVGDEVIDGDDDVLGAVE